MINVLRTVSKAEIILGGVFLFYFILCLLFGGIRVAQIYVWPLMWAGLEAVGVLGLIVTKRGMKAPSVIAAAVDIIIAVFFIACLIHSGIIIKDMKSTAQPGCDYVVVLGAKVDGTEPSKMLNARIDAAYNYLVENKNAVVIGTGGQGADEDISEGECIAKELILRGIDESRIRYENKSTSTAENVKYAFAETDGNMKSVAVVTTNFHIHRAKKIVSRSTDADVYGIPAWSLDIFTPHYIFREYVCCIADTLLQKFR